MPGLFYFLNVTKERLDGSPVTLKNKKRNRRTVSVTFDDLLFYHEMTDNISIEDFDMTLFTERTNDICMPKHLFTVP